MQYFRIIKLLPLLLLWVQIAVAQNFPSKNYTAANELPNNTVRSLFIDSKDVLWIGTENGLVKKENDIFTNFFVEDGLALNSCWAIAEDKKYRLWFGSYGEGISIYNGTEFKVISEQDGLVNNEITKLYSYRNSMLVGTSDGVSIIDVNTLKISSLKPATSTTLFRVQDFLEYQNELFVITYNSGVFKIVTENEQKKLIKVNNHKYNYSILKNNDSIYSSNKGFYTKGKISEYLSNSPNPKIKVGESIIWDYVKTKDNKIFAAAWGIYDSNGGIYEIINHKMVSRASDFSVSSNQIISLAYSKKFDKLFIGTKDSGYYEIKLNNKIKFHSLPEHRILGFAKTDSTTAILSNKDLILSKEEKELTISLSQFKEWQENYIRTTRIPLPKHQDDFYELDYNIRAEAINFYDIKVSANKFWLNTNIGIFAITPAGDLAKYLPLHSEEINFTTKGDLIETNPYGGLRIFNDLDKLENTYYNPADSNTPTMVVNSFQQASKTYLISIFSGLYSWENNKFKSFFKENIWNEKKLKHITSIENDLAVSNEFGDVFIINDEDTFQLLRKIPRAKILGNSISFLKGHNRALIIGTEKGITIYKNNKFIFLDEEQGLQQPLLSATIFDDNLFVGSDNGYYSIDLKSVNTLRSLIDEIWLKKVLINNRKFNFKEKNQKEQIVLSYNENTILLKFSTNAHPYPHKLTYQYRLTEQEDWSPPSSKPEIFLPFLPTKDYNITVRVLDRSTGLSYTQSLIKLAIQPPFWKTWWFMFLIFAIISMMVYTLYKIQIRQNKNFEEQKSMIQKRLEETKMEALLAQMNPHFIFNAMNSIQSYIVDRDIDNATSFLGDFAKLIRLNLDHCTKQCILLVEEIEYLQLYMRVENTRFNNKIHVNIAVDSKIDVYDVKIPTMLLQTFVENVFIHAFPPSISEPTLKVSFKLLPDKTLECKIKDNGIGISKISDNKLHVSKGIILVKERLSLLGYDTDTAVKINSKQSSGTIVTLQLKPNDY
ncbi:hypothetical protein SAMN04487764_1452 [Gillisia sp. Hel1_33_143]|uniref:sensor histidine kinase n=1 Tax=Gillisia sp. Hel1_33_143 TaxID=1336796 RepID=UPI0008792087|nr:histidine kinase [Gillisia sp. Hel1_33_143]SDS10026.1 hypothetical protein SAMN04487764_1452 [Gillisia sp. Hel1_33_143]